MKPWPAHLMFNLSGLKINCCQSSKFYIVHVECTFTQLTQLMKNSPHLVHQDGSLLLFTIIAKAEKPNYLCLSFAIQVNQPVTYNGAARVQHAVSTSFLKLPRSMKNKLTTQLKHEQCYCKLTRYHFFFVLVAFLIAVLTLARFCVQAKQSG